MANDQLVSSISTENIQSKIYTMRGMQVMIDTDLAGLYGVLTKRLTEQVKRNIKRFPENFMFQLTKDEFKNLMSQNATLKKGHGTHRKYLPYVFTEQEAANLPDRETKNLNKIVFDM